MADRLWALGCVLLVLAMLSTFGPAIPTRRGLLLLVGAIAACSAALILVATGVDV